MRSIAATALCAAISAFLVGGKDSDVSNLELTLPGKSDASTAKYQAELRNMINELQTTSEAGKRLIAAVEQSLEKTTKANDELVTRMVSQLEAMSGEAKDSKTGLTGPGYVQKTSAATCECDCPTLEQIRQVLREELNRRFASTAPSGVTSSPVVSGGSTGSYSAVSGGSTGTYNAVMSAPVTYGTYYSSTSYGSTGSNVVGSGSTGVSSYSTVVSPSYGAYPYATTTVKSGGIFRRRYTTTTTAPQSCRIVNGRMVCD